MNNLNALTLLPYSVWSRPTVKEVSHVLNDICHKYNISESELHNLLQLKSDRAIRRWREKYIVEPNLLSPIKYGQWALLLSLAYDHVIFPTLSECLVPKTLVMNYRDYKSIDISDIKKFVGKDSYSGLKASKLAPILGYTAAHLRRSFSDLPFHIYALIALYCGVKPCELFPV